MPCEHVVAFGGQTLAQKQIAGFAIAEAWYPPGTFVPRHTHAHAHLGFLLDGMCRESVGSRHYDYERLSLVLKRPGESHTNRAGPGGTRYLIVDAPDTDRIPGVFDERIELRSRRLVPLCLRIREELRAADEPAALALEGLLLELFAGLARDRSAEGRSAPAWLRCARDLLRDRACETLSLGEIAIELGVQPTQLARSFRRAFGVTPGAYHRRVRLERALALLESDRSLCEIASEAGYYDQSHLTRMLKRATGLTPAAYRQKLRD